MPNRLGFGITLALIMLAGGTMLPRAAAIPAIAAQAGPPTPAQPLHHPHVGKVVGVHDEVLHVRYPASDGAMAVSVPLGSAFLRAGFYPQTRLPWAHGQRVLVLGARSAHPTVMLLPEAVGSLAMSEHGWTLSGREGTFPLVLRAPRLLGGARLEPNQHVEVFGSRYGHTITAAIVAAKPRIERAVVTAVYGGRIRLAGSGGKTWEFATATVSPDLARHLQALGPRTPVLAVVAPDGAVLGVLPLKVLHSGWPPTRFPGRPNRAGPDPVGRSEPLRIR